MRMIGNISDEADARRFGDYLLSQGIDNDIEPAGDEWAVWVHHDDHLDRANEALADFRKYPRDARYTGVKTTARKVRRQQAQEQRRLRRNYVDVRTSWHGRASGARPLTAVLMILSVLITMGTQFGTADNALTDAVSFAAHVPEHEVEARIEKFLFEGDHVRYADAIDDNAAERFWRSLNLAVHGPGFD